MKASGSQASTKAPGHPPDISRYSNISSLSLTSAPVPDAPRLITLVHRISNDMICHLVGDSVCERITSHISENSGTDRRISQPHQLITYHITGERKQTGSNVDSNYRSLEFTPYSSSFIAGAGGRQRPPRSPPVRLNTSKKYHHHNTTQYR